jgi:hypothetical protein
MTPVDIPAPTAMATQCHEPEDGAGLFISHGGAYQATTKQHHKVPSLRRPVEIFAETIQLGCANRNLREGRSKK